MNQHWLTACLFLASAALARADSQLPHNTFDGAVDLGLIDYIGPVPEMQNRKVFRCFHEQAGLNFARPPFETYYYKFKVNGTKARVWVRMQESPPTTMWLRTYDGDRIFLKEYRGNAGELIDDVFTSGTYYVQVLTEGNVPHLPDGTNIGNLTFRGMSGDNFSDVPGQTEPINLGTVSATPIKRIDALSFVQGRTRTWRKPGANCDQGEGADKTPYLYDDRDEFVATAPAGRVYASIVQTFDRQNWNSPVKLFRWESGNLGGAWQEISGAPFDHPGGQLKLHVGSFDTAVIAVEDSYIGYELSIRMQ
jgi:hypothetical protein